MKILKTSSLIRVNFLIALFILIIPFTSTASTILSLDKSQIRINENENYALLNLKIFQDGKQITWKTKETLKASENITISDTDKIQYGYKNNKELLFIPLGISENDYEYQLIIMPNRQLLTNITKDFIIKIPLLSDEGVQVSVSVSTRKITLLSSEDKDITAILSEKDKKEIIDSVKNASNNETLYSVILGTVLGIIIPLSVFALRKNDLKDTFSQRILSTDNRIVDEFRNINNIQLEVISRNLTIEQTVKEIHNISEESKKDLKSLNEIGLKINPDLRNDFQKASNRIINRVSQSEKLSKHLELSLKDLNSELVKLDLAIKKVENESVNDLLDLQTELLNETKKIKTDLLLNLNSHGANMSQVSELMRTRLDHLQFYIDQKISTLRPIDYDYLDQRAESIFEEKYRNNRGM